MKTIETTVTVTSEQQITITLPSDIAPGKHRIVLVIDETPLPPDVDTAKPSQKERKILEQELFLDDSEPSTQELMNLAQTGGAFNFLYDEPDIYTLEDGEPV